MSAPPHPIGATRSKRWLLNILLCIAVAAGLLTPLALPPSVQAQRIPAPELTGGTDFLGVDRPFRLKDLRGKIVLLDFWTLC